MSEEFWLAQVNIARMRAPLDDPLLAGFVARLGDINALADSVDRSAQRVGRLALQLDRNPQSAIFGRKPGRPGPGEPGFQ